MGVSGGERRRSSMPEKIGAHCRAPQQLSQWEAGKKNAQATDPEKPPSV